MEYSSVCKSSSSDSSAPKKGVMLKTEKIDPQFLGILRQLPYHEEGIRGIFLFHFYVDSRSRYIPNEIENVQICLMFFTQENHLMYRVIIDLRNTLQKEKLPLILNVIEKILLDPNILKILE